MAPIETMEKYLRADMFFSNERGNMKATVVIMAWRDLNRVRPSLGLPVMSGERPKLLQQITKSLVTKHI